MPSNQTKPNQKPSEKSMESVLILACVEFAFVFGGH